MKVQLVLATLTISMAAVSAGAVTELLMVQLGGKFYHFSKNTLSWLDAQKFCRSNNLELAALETQQENQLVVDYANKVQGYTWIGGTDESSEGRWKWSGFERALTYTNWGPGHPDGGSAENCLSICNSDVSKGAWCDHPCTWSSYYICEGR